MSSISPPAFPSHHMSSLSWFNYTQLDTWTALSVPDGDGTDPPALPALRSNKTLSQAGPGRTAGCTGSRSRARADAGRTIFHRRGALFAATLALSMCVEAGRVTTTSRTRRLTPGDSGVRSHAG